MPLLPGDAKALTAALKSRRPKSHAVRLSEDHLNAPLFPSGLRRIGWAQNAVLTPVTRYLGDSGSPLLLHTDSGWQLIGGQSPPLRLKIAGAPITALYPRHGFAMLLPSRAGLVDANRCLTGSDRLGARKFYHDHSGEQQYHANPAFGTKLAEEHPARRASVAAIPKPPHSAYATDRKPIPLPPLGKRAEGGQNSGKR